MEKLNIKYFLTTVFLCVSCSLFATSQNDFQKGNEAFNAQKYVEAIQLFEAIIESGQHSTELYFNLGNAYFENKNLGKAILNYERALKTSNGNKDVQKNLKIAQAKISDEIEPLPPFFVTKFFGNIRDVFSSTGWAILAIIGLWFGLGILILKNLSIKNPLPENLRKPIAIGGLTLASFSLLFGFAKNYHDHNFKEAIILVEKTGLKEAADSASTDFLSLHEGTKVELLDRIGDWLKVRLADGDEGWLNEKDLELI